MLIHFGGQRLNIVQSHVVARGLVEKDMPIFH